MPRTVHLYDVDSNGHATPIITVRIPSKPRRKVKGWVLMSAITIGSIWLVWFSFGKVLGL